MRPRSLLPCLVGPGVLAALGLVLLAVVLAASALVAALPFQTGEW